MAAQLRTIPCTRCTNATFIAPDLQIILRSDRISTTLQIWSSASKEENPGALKLLPRDVRSLKMGAEIDPRNPFIGVYLTHRPWWLLCLIVVAACIMMGIIGARWKATDATLKYGIISGMLAVFYVAGGAVIWKWATRFESEFSIP